jgi:hypothetical protein
MREYKLELFKIGETYIKFDFEFNDRNKELIKKAYLQQVGFTSSELLRNRELFKISIEYDKGSLKTRIVIWGTAICMGVANYGSFRAGIREIVNHVKTFSEYVISNIDNDPDIAPNNIIRTERRTGIPGRIQELYNRIDKLERNLNTLSNREIQVELNTIKQEVSNLQAFLPQQDRQVFIQELANNYKQNLPAPEDRRTEYLINRYGLRPEEEIEFINN